ncbi:MAG: hypothetical protein ACKVQJ_08125 [Pyrinomonadaceae bacterium]
MSKKHFFSALAVVFALFCSANAQQWRPVGGSRQANISGMALIAHEKKVTTLLVVHDNKKPEQIHATILTINGADSPIFTPLKWNGTDIPVDLEAVTSVPGRPGEYMVLAAAGRVYHVRIDLKLASVEPIRSFDLPMIPKDSDFESLSLQKVNDSMLAVWAERGLTEKPATVFWSKLDLNTYKFSEVDWAAFRVPYPTADVRHISDLKVEPTGAVFVTSASDPGNDGPFSSAAYFAGVFRTDTKGKTVLIQPAMFTPLFRFDYHKVEAFDMVPGADGGFVFGTDDENLGAAILLWN